MSVARDPQLCMIDTVSCQVCFFLASTGPCLYLSVSQHSKRPQAVFEQAILPFKDLSTDPPLAVDGRSDRGPGSNDRPIYGNIGPRKELLSQHRSRQSEEPKKEMQNGKFLGYRRSGGNKKIFIIIVLTFSHTQLT